MERGGGTNCKIIRQRIYLTLWSSDIIIKSWRGWEIDGVEASFGMENLFKCFEVIDRFCLEPFLLHQYSSNYARAHLFFFLGNGCTEETNLLIDGWPIELTRTDSIICINIFFQCTEKNFWETAAATTRKILHKTNSLWFYRAHIILVKSCCAETVVYLYTTRFKNA